MRNFNTKLITALAQDVSINNLFRQPLEDAINLLLERERTVFLMRSGKWKVIITVIQENDVLYLVWTIELPPPHGLSCHYG